MRRSPLLLRLAIASLVIGAFALVRNLLSTFSTLQEYPGTTFLPVFLSTEGDTGGTSPIFVFFVWGPLVFGLLGIALLVAHVVTSRAGRAQQQQPQQQAWQQPQQQGWQQPQPWQPQQPQQPQQQPQQQPPQNPVQPLGGQQQPPPPNASDRIQP
ncbi:hypothetical protein GCM10009846_19600 [Agrococcus versicolor]|uniref:Uncharacterized protein n=1 Tax=Agrococcus versicolor TaxID=501482 RepID=A0ABP5MHZ4_9MICO